MNEPTGAEQRNPGVSYKPAVKSDLHKRARRILTGKATYEDRFVPDHAEAVALLELLRSMECKIVYSSGVWDLFHIGHAAYIQKGKDEAAKHYDNPEHVVMVVAVDTDELTKRRKGDRRPIVPMDERCRVLAHLRAVDIIVPQYESDQLFCLLPYDVRVISQSTSDLPGTDRMRQYCEYLVNLPPQSETSTTARVRGLAIDGRLEALEEVEKGLRDLLDKVRNANAE